jgi:hypothetical protein
MCLSPELFYCKANLPLSISLKKDCLIRFLRYLRAQPAHDSSWDTSYLSPRTLLKQICLSSLQKGLSHAIVRIFRQTTCTLRVVASWDMSSLFSQVYTAANLPFKLKKGLSHKISRIFNQRACTIICVSPQSSSILYSKSTFVSLIRDCLIFLRYFRAQPAQDSSSDPSFLSPGLYSRKSAFQE